MLIGQVWAWNSTCGILRGMNKQNIRSSQCFACDVGFLSPEPVHRLYIWQVFRVFIWLENRTCRAFPALGTTGSAPSSFSCPRFVSSKAAKLFVFLQGVAYVMHAADLDHQTAIVACKQCRPVVDPIGRFLGKFQFRKSHWIEMGKRDMWVARHQGIMETFVAWDWT